MAQRNTTRTSGSRRSLRAQVGAVLLTLGLLLMFGNVSLALAGLPGFLNSLGIEAIGLPAAAALAILKFFRTLPRYCRSLVGYWYYSSLSQGFCPGLCCFAGAPWRTRDE
jgi:hypothetical protein